MVRATRFFVVTLLMGTLVLAINIAPVSADGGSQILLTSLNTQTILSAYCGLNPRISNVNVMQGYTEDGSGVYGWYMDITWTTSKNAGAIIAVSRQPASSDVDGNEFAQVDGVAIQLARTGPNHSVRISHLKSSTYYFIIEAIDANGNKTKYHGVYHFYANL